MIWIAAIAAAGWILAAFLCGMLVGRVRDGPKEEKPESGVARGADCLLYTSRRGKRRSYS